MQDFTENTTTEVVLSSFKSIKDQRIKKLISSIVTHLHEVVNFHQV